MKHKFKAGDRVRAIEEEGAGVGPLGTVKKVRVESARQSIKDSSNEPPGVTVTVMWDNGTVSHFVPDSLVMAS